MITLYCKQSVDKQANRQPKHGYAGTRTQATAQPNDMLMQPAHTAYECYASVSGSASVRVSASASASMSAGGNCLSVNVAGK